MSAPIQLPDEEPWFETPRVVAPAALAHEIVARLAEVAGRAGVVAIDGRSGSGKTTIARTLAAHIDDSVVVATDDLAWHHSFFDWSHMLVDDILEPVHAHRPVTFRPPAWSARDRPGAIEVPRRCRVLIVEGVGAARRETAHLVDVVIWVQSDLAAAERRGMARDGDDDAAIEFWHEWMAAERPFLAEHRPWERAHLVVAGVAGHAPDPSPDLAATAWRRPG